MRASDGEILTLRPDGFVPDMAAIEAYLNGLPGLYRHSDDAPWTLVAPASDLPRLLSDPNPKTSRPGDPQYVLVSVSNDEIWIHPGYTTLTWARAQRVAGWLLKLGPWRVSGQDRELGVIRDESDLFQQSYYDPDIPTLDPKNPTESPPRVGVLTTYRHLSGDPESPSYFHTVFRVHSSGAFSCDQKSPVDDVHWEGRLDSTFVERWNSLVAQLDFAQPPVAELDPVSLVTLGVEHPGHECVKLFDAAHPPESFAVLVRLLEDWAQSLLEERPPAELTDLVMTFARDTSQHVS